MLSRTHSWADGCQEEGMMGLFHPKKRAIVSMKNIGGSERYDLVIEDADGQFWRVQCKTGRCQEPHS